MKKSKVTTEDLAVMIQSGFRGVDERFEGIDKRFDKMEDWQGLADGKFDSLEHELLNIKKDLENIIYRHEFENLRERVQRLENVVAHKKK